MNGQYNIALLIDCDNARPTAIQGIMDELAKHGATNIRRAYGNWKVNPGWEERLHPFAILPIQQFAYTKGKNATDIAMSIDAVEILYNENVDCFAIVSSDSDFTPLVMKIREKARKVIGFGERKTPEPFVKSCSLFIYTDDFSEHSGDEAEAPKEKKNRNELRGDTELMNILRNAIRNMKEDDDWAALSKIGTYIANNSSISPSNYGYPKWLGLIRATEYFDEECRNGNLYYIRLKKPVKVPETKKG